MMQYYMSWEYSKGAMTKHPSPINSAPQKINSLRSRDEGIFPFINAVTPDTKVVAINAIPISIEDLPKLVNWELMLVRIIDIKSAVANTTTKNPKTLWLLLISFWILVKEIITQLKIDFFNKGQSDFCCWSSEWESSIGVRNLIKIEFIESK